LKLPEIFKEIPKEKTGLVLVTGATGSGKSTTLAAVLNEINRNQGRPHRHAGRPG
jgi:twitching motility protein PilT